LYFYKIYGLISTKLPFFLSTLFLIATCVFLRLEFNVVSSVCFLKARVEGVDSLRFYFRLGISSALVFIGGNFVTVLVCDSLSD